MNGDSKEQFWETELDFWKKKYLDLKNTVGDIEVRKRLEEEMRLDPLTRILNKKAFREEQNTQRFIDIWCLCLNMRRMKRPFI